jgi:hypothetical protein
VLPCSDFQIAKISIQFSSFALISLSVTRSSNIPSSDLISSFVNPERYATDLVGMKEPYKKL